MGCGRPLRARSSLASLRRHGGARLACFTRVTTADSSGHLLPAVQRCCGVAFKVNVQLTLWMIMHWGLHILTLYVRLFASGAGRRVDLTGTPLWRRTRTAFADARGEFHHSTASARAGNLQRRGVLDHHVQPPWRNRTHVAGRNLSLNGTHLGLSTLVGGLGNPVRSLSSSEPQPNSRHICGLNLSGKPYSDMWLPSCPRPTA